MTWENYTAFLLFVIVMTGTPGVGNLTMMAIGQTSGFRSSLPFLAGTTVGAIFLDTLVGFGVGGVLLATPELAWAMKIGGMGYILYLGWKILSMRPDAARTKGPLSFWEGVFVHPTNPKSWAMAVVGFSQIATPEMSLPLQVAVYVLTFTVFQISFHSLWGWGGVVLYHSLKSNRLRLMVNSVLVALMVGATMYALFLDTPHA
ncbi:MAG: lysine transporter LysE [Desulfovibrio sp.]|nr:lysine transporter LysE [Desulfovibrio sp.]|tara:strand:+ start:970 stop:1578 length:609 start_codon:yes stop_codon:yes gene_type:complete